MWSRVSIEGEIPPCRQKNYAKGYPYLTLDDCSQRQVVEELREVLPHVAVAILARALVVEAVDLRDLPRFVVSSQNCDAVTVSDLQGNQQSDTLYRMMPAVYVIAHEQIVRVLK